MPRIDKSSDGQSCGKVGPMVVESRVVVLVESVCRCSCGFRWGMDFQDGRAVEVLDWVICMVGVEEVEWVSRIVLVLLVESWRVVDCVVVFKVVD